MPDSTVMNLFQVFPITRLLQLGPYLCPEVCSSRPYMESQETALGKMNYISDTEFSLGCCFKEVWGNVAFIRHCWFKPG